MAMKLAFVLDELNKEEGIVPLQIETWKDAYHGGIRRRTTAQAWIEFANEMVATNKHYDPVIEIKIAAENESKVTYQIEVFRYFELVERVEDLGITYGDGQVVPAETFMNAVEDPDQYCCDKDIFDVTVDFEKIGGTMKNAKLCHLEKGRCSPEIKIENGQVTKIFWGDV